LLAGSPESAELHVALGHSLQSAGSQKEAIECYRTAAVIRPGFGDAYWSLANLKTYHFPPQEIERMRAEEAAQSVQPVDRWHLCFALGKAYEDQGEYAESWRFYERGNSLKRTQTTYDSGRAEINSRQQMEVFTPSFFAACTGYGAPDRDPIFIVG